MRHTSIRLSDEHAEKIMKMGESPTAVIRKALDLFLGMSSEDMEPAHRLIEEAIQRHVKTCHKDEHVVSTNKPLSESVPTDEHAMSTEVRTALTLILDELRAGREPTVNQIADEVGLTTNGLGRGLSKLGIKSKNTHRDMQTVRLYPKTLMVKIKEILT